MEFLTDDQTWECREPEVPSDPNIHFPAPEIDQESLEADLNGNIHKHYGRGVSQQHGLPFYQENELSEQIFSPTISFQGTPLLSPHAMAPQNVAQRQFSHCNHTPQGTPQGTPLMGPSHTSFSFIYSPSSTSAASSAAGSVTEYGTYFSTMRYSGKIVKHSPAVRWQAGSLTGSVSEDEFQLGDAALGDPALEIAAFGDRSLDTGKEPPFFGELSINHGSRRASAETDEVEERLRKAIAATTRAQSRSSSTPSLRPFPSRRASLGSNRTTPRILPKISAINTELSPSHDMQEPHSHDVLFLKSNYQNLVDGTHQHLGLSSADKISNYLRSKKVMHKLAEQERRNRLNSAIRELSKVLGGEENKPAASKAATVEKAAQYIIRLQVQIADLEARLGDSSEGVNLGNSVSPRIGNS